MSLLYARLRMVFDNYTLIIIGVILASTFFPAHGTGEFIFKWLTNAAIALLFFLHGAKLSRQAVIAGALHWRLHLLIFAFTFILFPVLMVALTPVLKPLLGDELWIGMLYLAALPGTVQSAIAFTSMARGNIPAAVCAASASSLVGILVTPLLVKIMLGADAGTSGMLDAVIKISVQLLFPFLLGHYMRRWIGNFVDNNRNWLRYVDQGSILLVVYTAFSSAVMGGLWHAVPPQSLIILTLVCAVILALVLVLTTWGSRALNFNKEDEITIVFCGSKKSMATGVPMAQVLFAGGAVGPAILPLMVFHQIQLMVCAVMAQHYAKRESPGDVLGGAAKAD